MKRKDFLLIAVVIIISTMFALLLSSLVIGSPQDNQQQVEVVQEITSDFPTPDKRYFNDKAINPTKLITIGDNANPNPFTSTESPR